MVEQAKRDTIKAAYVAVYEAENTLRKMIDPGLEGDVHGVQQQTEDLRKTLVEKPDETDMIRRATEELQKVCAYLARLGNDYLQLSLSRCANTDLVMMSRPTQL